MTKKLELSQASVSGLFDRVASILDQARDSVVRSVNTNMVLAYWLIGREIVQELQGGDERAEYGKQVVESLSLRLNARYGRGFAPQALWDFRLSYQTYADRSRVLSPPGRELSDAEKLFPPGNESKFKPLESRIESQQWTLAS